MVPTVVFGLGSLLMGDEAVGVMIVQELQRRRKKWRDVEWLDMGVAGFKVLHYLSGREKAVFIDCAFMGEEPGTIRRFTPAEVSSRLNTCRFTSHSTDLLDIITLSRNLGEAPGEIVFYGIEPQKVVLHEGLSACLQKRWKEYIRLVEREVRNA